MALLAAKIVLRAKVELRATFVVRVTVKDDLHTTLLLTRHHKDAESEDFNSSFSL